MKRLVGLDLSLVATGFADRHGTCVLKTKLRGMARLDWIERAILDELEPDPLVIVEGYSYGSRGSAVYNIAELGGVVRLALWRAGITYVEVAPGALKKFTTGKGNASKDEMIAGAIRRWGFDGSNNNEADAYMLRQMGLAKYDSTWEGPEYAQVAVGHVEWPELEDPLTTEAR